MAQKTELEIRWNLFADASNRHENRFIVKRLVSVFFPVLNNNARKNRLASSQKVREKSGLKN